MSDKESVEALKVEIVWRGHVIKLLSGIILLLIGQTVDVLAILQGILK